MKNDVIEQFYLGNIVPGDQSFDRNTEYAQALNTLTEAETQLREALVNADKGALEALIEAQHTIECISMRESFTKGFRLGAKFLLAVFDDSGDTLHDIIE